MPDTSPAGDTTPRDTTPDAEMTLDEWRAECPWLDKPDHEPTACFHCATDDELEAALAGRDADDGTTDLMGGIW